MTPPRLLARGHLTDATPWTVEATSHRTWWTVVKRAIDVAAALLLLTAIMPLLLIVAVLIKLDSPGPVFYRVRRVGYRGRPLDMLKFRKMHEHATGGPLTAANDPRLTRVGKLLTRTRLDELPQLWDVLRGRMSIIGPRPEDPHFVRLHQADYEVILSIRPGMTGLAQLAYVEESRIVDELSPVEDYIMRIMPQKLTLDKVYASRSSLRLDLAIIAWTIVTLILGRPVAVNRLTGRMGVRHRRRASDRSSTNGRTEAATGTNGHAAEVAPTLNGQAAEAMLAREASDSSRLESSGGSNA
jgi:lipopolysaccharide/colanic/teichoic acid biosynthesis glycosyltransferase